MHIPDGFLDARTVIATSTLSVAGLTVALRQARQDLPRHRIPLVGMTAAFVFAAQMLNFPVVGGTSGHLLGGVLAAILVGPSAAVVVMACVLLLQALLFADGGVLAIGANIFNMAIVGTLGGYGVYRAIGLIGNNSRVQFIAVAVASWSSVVFAAITCAGQLALSGTISWKLVFPAMMLVHMLIGIGEALITAAILVAIRNLDRGIIAETRQAITATSCRAATIFGLLIAAGLALFVAPFTCAGPDGLEKVAASLGFDGRAMEKPLLASPLSGYQFPWIFSEGFATAVAGTLGTILTFLLVFALTRRLVSRSPTDGAPS